MRIEPNGLKEKLIEKEEKVWLGDLVSTLGPKDL